MTDYEKSYIKWFVVAFVIGFALGMGIKGCVMMIPAYKDGNLALDAIANFITPACCILSQFIMLAIYGKKKQEAQDEREKEEEKKTRHREQSDDDMVLNYEAYDKKKDSIRPVVYDEKTGGLVEVPQIKPVAIEKVEGLTDGDGKDEE